MIDMRSLAIMRSGSHAVINWIAGLYDDVLYFNDANPKSDPIKNGRRCTRLLSCKGKIRCDDVRPQLMIRGFENKDLSHFARKVKAYPDACNVINVLLLRDPFNNLASKLIQHFRKRGTVDSARLEHGIAIWKQYAGEYLRMTTHLNDVLPISYNHWFSSLSYRKRLAKVLGRPFNDASLSQVCDYYGGSSFDGLKKSGQEMQVLDRWRVFQDVDEFRKPLLDASVLDLACKIFPVVTEQFVRNVQENKSRSV